MADDQSPAYLSLDTRGVIRGMKQKARALLDAYFTSDYSQSTLYYDGIRSITKDIQRSGTDESELADNVRQSLAYLYQRYFFSVNVDVKVLEMDTDESRWNIRVNMEIANENGEQMNLAAISETEAGLAWRTQWIE